MIIKYYYYYKKLLIKKQKATKLNIHVKSFRPKLAVISEKAPKGHRIEAFNEQLTEFHQVIITKHN